MNREIYLIPNAETKTDFFDSLEDARKAMLDDVVSTYTSITEKNTTIDELMELLADTHYDSPVEGTIDTNHNYAWMNFDLSNYDAYDIKILKLKETNMYKQALADVGTEWFEEAENAFRQTPDFTECTTEAMETLIENAERGDMVATNIGNVPIEDYREIVANQNGFDSYDEMYNEGIRIGNGYDKEPESVKPQW